MKVANFDDASARRPADVFIPRWRAGPAVALDFAVTSGMRPNVLAASSRGGEAACIQYEDFKRSHKDTANECRRQGFGFIPMVVEAVGGGWGKEARKVWSEFAKSSALASGEFASESSCGSALQQRLSLILHRENARACLRRFGHGGQAPSASALSVAATAAE